MFDNSNVFRAIEAANKFQRHLNSPAVEAANKFAAVHNHSLKAAIAAASNHHRFKNNPAILQANRVMKFQRLAQKAFEKFKQGYDNFKYLVPRGWYISPKVLNKLELNRISELCEFTDISNLDEFENYILNSFDNRKEEVFIYLTNTFNSRKHIFEEIHKMYDLQLYYGLITLCYSQADGMSNEIWKMGFFTNDPDTKYEYLKIQKLNTKKETFSKALINQLGEARNEITEKSNNSKYKIKENKENSINRNLVLHGHSKYYGNRENAIRAILLLEFICDLVNEEYKL
jgi:hypothetical protein